MLFLFVSAQVVTGAGHCHGAAADETEACGDSDDGQAFHFHPYHPTQQPRQKWKPQSPNTHQTILGQACSQHILLEPPAANSRPSEQSRPSS